MSKFNCDCIEKVDDYLGKKNTRITQALVLDPNSQSPGVMIETEQVETGRGKPKAVGMFASHCPFCGMKYGEIKGIDLTEGMLSLSWRIIHALTVHGFENDADISKLLESHQPLILTAIKNAFNDTATNPYKAELVKLAALVDEEADPFAAWESLERIVEAWKDLAKKEIKPRFELRVAAVQIVDMLRGYTFEFSATPDEHLAEYDRVEQHLRDLAEGSEKAVD